MPYDYYDANGYLAPGPSIPQWRLLRAHLTGTEGKAMAETGRTDRPLALADELPSDAPAPEGPLLVQLRRAAEQADTLLFVGSGTQAEPQA